MVWKSVVLQAQNPSQTKSFPSCAFFLHALVRALARLPAVVAIARVYLLCLESVGPEDCCRFGFLLDAFGKAAEGFAVDTSTGYFVL